MKGHRPSITDDQKFRMTIVRSQKIFKGIILQAQLIRQLAQSGVSVAQLIRQPNIPAYQLLPWQIGCLLDKTAISSFRLLGFHKWIVAGQA